MLGHITVGDNVAIGANTVITKSIDANQVVTGASARIISESGSSNYILHKHTEKQYS